LQFRPIRGAWCQQSCVGLLQQFIDIGEIARIPEQASPQNAFAFENLEEISFVSRVQENSPRPLEWLLSKRKYRRAA
jgi:hypothetical protein